jgi:hypothetical protein
VDQSFIEFIMGHFSMAPHVNVRKTAFALKHHTMNTHKGIAVELHSILTSAPNGNGRLPVPAAFSLGKSSGYPPDRELGGIQSQRKRGCEGKKPFLGCVRSAVTYFTLLSYRGSPTTARGK